MSDRKQIRLKRNRIILAFPGMGKTPLSNSNGMFKDVDFGTFRAGMGYTKENEVKLLPIFRNYLAALDADWDHVTIMTNEPKLMEYVKIDRMYLPADFGYSAKKMHVSLMTISEWVKDWESMANRFKVPVVWVKKGLDHYLNSRI